MSDQKLYLIPTTPSYEYEPYNHIYLVTAHSNQDAYNKANLNLMQISHKNYLNMNHMI